MSTGTDSPYVLGTPADKAKLVLPGGAKTNSEWYTPFVAVTVAAVVFMILFIVFAALFGERVRVLKGG